MMPDLPNVGWHRDLESFTEFFENPAFRTDGLKVYPTLVIRGTGLYELWKTGLYRNYDPRLLVDLVARILALVPPWVCTHQVYIMVYHSCRLSTLSLQSAADRRALSSAQAAFLLDCRLDCSAAFRSSADA